MPDPRFFRASGPFSLGELAGFACADISAGADPSARFSDVAPLDAAGPDHVSFLDDRRYRDRFVTSKAGACLVRPEDGAEAPKGMALLLTPQPYLGYARIAAAFYPPKRPEPGIHPHATVDPTSRIGEGCCIEAGAAVGPLADIGRDCHIGHHVVIGRGVVIGNDCVIGAGASLMFCIVGDRVLIHPGARIGQDGFGLVPGREQHVKVPQLGRVVIGDDVEIGANTTIDRGAVSDTAIGAGSKIDNLVQIGHNVRLGRNCVVVAQVGISGSTTVGNGVMIAGQAGLAGHLTIGDGARVGAQSGLMRDVGPGETVLGCPATQSTQFLRQVALLARLAKTKGH